jgi:hypothetical protein
MLSQLRGFQMPSYKVAHLNEQGQDMIIIPLESAFGRQSQAEQQAELDALQYRANAAGLRGSAVVVWDAGGSRMGFLGPHQWHPFLKGLNLRLVFSSLNKEISW